MAVFKKAELGAFLATVGSAMVEQNIDVEEVVTGSSEDNQTLVESLVEHGLREDRAVALLTAVQTAGLVDFRAMFDSIEVEEDAEID